MASARLRQNLPLLKALAKTKSAQARKEIMNAGGDDLTKSICECATNVLNGNARLTPTQLRKLRKYKNGLRNIVGARSLGAKKRHIQQQGGAFLPALIAPLIGLIGSLFSK